MNPSLCEGRSPPQKGFPSFPHLPAMLCSGPCHTCGFLWHARGEQESEFCPFLGQQPAVLCPVTQHRPCHLQKCSQEPLAERSPSRLCQSLTRLCSVTLRTTVRVDWDMKCVLQRLFKLSQLFSTVFIWNTEEPCCCSY